MTPEQPPTSNAPHTPAPAAARPRATPTPSPAERESLELRRLAEKRSRPVTAEVHVYSGRASLRWVDAEGRACPLPWAPVPLGEHDHALHDKVVTRAGDEVAKRGFARAPGAYWRPYAPEGDPDPQRPRWARLAIVPTRAYLDLQNRRFGPAPTLPETDGVTFETKERGQWWATVHDGRTFLLEWVPFLYGDQWRVRGGPDYCALILTTPVMEKALYVLRNPSHART